ncbi:MAG TPA: endolytic transglycosylase MltG [Luteimonas sp.]|nr:endolytic transglycosylase MltG [Luteimonas sp.]
MRRVLRVAMVVFVASALLAGALAVAAWSHYAAFVDAPLGYGSASARIRIEPGDSFKRVLARVRAAGIEDGHALEWQLLGRQLGAAGRIQVGEYALEAGTTPRQLLVAMRDGKVVSHRFTIVEGWSMRELRAALARARPLRQTLAQLDDAALMRALDRPGVHAEGRFLPETYAYTSGDSDVDLLRRANADLERALQSAWAARAPDLPLASPEEALVLASIVEKETGIASERDAVAGVFVRRLRLGMRLQTDPTVIYGMGSAYAGNIRRSDLLTDTPYNTYTRDGLPPTPIAMAGAAAIRAATQPAAGDALYFVALGDGSGRHVFSPTLDAHNAAVREYVRRYRQRHAP